MGDRDEAPAGVAAPCGEGAGAAQGMPSRAGSIAGIRRGAQRMIGTPSQGRTPAKAPNHAIRYAPAAVLHAMHARPELDYDSIGSYMRDAIGRGGYRAALEYYGSDEAHKSDTPLHRLRATGWLLGRLGHYDRVQGWLEGVADSPNFDHLSNFQISGMRAPCRTPPLWLDPPRPVPRSTNRILTLEPVAASGPDIGAVPGYIWPTMLILDTTGPICSHAGLGAALFLLGVCADVRKRGPARAGRRYDPLRGARLHGAPEGCHRWIIADIDFDPHPANEPHYYYDLTDEGRRALDAARGGRSQPWPDAAEAAASGLEGMTLPDLLERACSTPGMPPHDLGKMRDDLGRVVGAWRSQEEGRPVPPVGEADRPLVDLGAAVKWPCDDCGPGSAVDYLFSLMTTIGSAHAIAGEAEPSSYAEHAVLQALIGAIQDTCRRHAGAVLDASSGAGHGAAPACGSSAGDEDVPRQPWYADVTTALISDLHYCLSEYCESRGLAVDPCNVQFHEQFTEDEKAAVIEALTRDNPLYDDMGGSPHGS